MREFCQIQTDKDIKTLAALASSIWHKYWADKLSAEQTEYMIDKFQSYDAIIKQINEEKYTYKIIKDNDEYIGYFAFAVKEKPVWDTDKPFFAVPYLFLSKIYLKKDYRKQGIGKEIFSYIRDYAKTQGLKRIILTVNKYNENSIKAYEKWGFKTTESAITDIGCSFVMDDFIMEYDIRG